MILYSVDVLISSQYVAISCSVRGFDPIKLVSDLAIEDIANSAGTEEVPGD